MNEPRPHTESELVELVRAADEQAPETLHRAVSSLIAAHAPRGGRRSLSAWPAGAGRPATRLRIGGALVAAAAILVAIIAGTTGGGASRLNIRQASALTLRQATSPAPPERASHRGQLALAVDGVSFPYWEDRFGWRSTGARNDRIAGQAVTTVFYADGHGHRIGYAILAGAPLRVSGGHVVWRGQARYRMSYANGAPMVTWLRDGHMCVLSGRGVSGDTLLRLASWDDGSPVAS
jgi:hypothetical protein